MKSRVITQLLAAFALATATSALAAPGDPAVELEKGREAYLEEDFTRAEKHFRTLVQLVPESYAGHLFLGHSLYFQGRFPEAIPEYEKAKELGVQSGTMTQQETRILNDQLGISYGTSGQLQAAKQLLEAAIESDPEYAMYYYNLGCTHAELGNLEEAIRYLEQGFDHRQTMLPGTTYPDPRKDDSFKRYLEDERFEAALKQMGF